MNDRFNIRYFNKNSKKFEYLKIGAVNFNLFTDWTVYEQGQFCTGLKDKNGKLIYEGDIVTYEWLAPISKVWRKDGKHIVEWHDGFTVIGNIAGYDVEHGKSRNVEVIGNIYENKELLESEG